MGKLMFRLAAVTLMVGLAQAVAFGASSTPTAKTLTAKLKVSTANIVSGTTCTVGYSNQCFSGTCSCLTDSAATISGGIAGKGTAVVSLTIDTGLSVPISSITSPTQSACAPAFGNVEVTGTLKGQQITETMSMALVLCNSFTSSGKSSVNGGFGIESTNDTPPLGFGTVTGTSDKATKLATLTLKGSVTNP